MLRVARAKTKKIYCSAAYFFSQIRFCATKSIGIQVAKFQTEKYRRQIGTTRDRDANNAWSESVGRLSHTRKLHCALSLAAQCIVIGPVCGFVAVFMCVFVCVWRSLLPR